ncbi:MAG: hypothetical protein Q4D13_06830 [Erysipelotrichaceae bacterium]|nr:hypothetical protein [Erysipelotrichaceae bacterium]
MKAYTKRWEHERDVSQGGNYTTGTREKADRMLEVLDVLPHKISRYGDRYWKFWSYEPVPTIDEYREESYYEDDEDFNEEDVVRSYKDLFRDQEYDWFLIEINHTDNDYIVIGLNEDIKTVIKPMKEVHDDWNSYDEEEFIEWLTDRALEWSDSLKDNTYAEKIRNGLPYFNRTGIIPGIKMMEIDNHYDKYFNTAFPEDRRNDLIEYIDSEDKIEPLKSMTLNGYLEICDVFYHGAVPDRCVGTPLENYKRIGDGRDGGMIPYNDCERDENGNLVHFVKCNVPDPDSEDDWLNFVETSSQKLWDTGTNPSHRWEVIAGGSRTRIHMVPQHDNNGWVLNLYGGVECGVDEVVGGYLALRDAGIPVKAEAAPYMKRYAKMEFNVAVIPGLAFYAHYDTFEPDENIKDYCNLIDFTDEQQEKIIKETNWLDPFWDHIWETEKDPE